MSQCIFINIWESAKMKTGKTGCSANKYTSLFVCVVYFLTITVINEQFKNEILIFELYWKNIYYSFIIHVDFMSLCLVAMLLYTS